ncbi:hypothetical protein Q0M94_03540 [Deinococcus radiomollis]|uniref:hypothetical protein n=1 Tax=Deinococcus radiomollis TaxID=468916 RepID=UPI003892770E
MPLTGTSKRGPATQAAPTIRLKDLLDQLEHEYTLLRTEELTDHEAAIRAYFHVAAHTALYWINGDPYRFEPPYDTFKTERLYKLCLYLRGLDLENGQALKEARAAQLTQLRGPAWTNYEAMCLVPVEIPNGMSALDLEILPFTWEGIDTLWQTQEPVPAERPADYLPKFACKESEDWHLVCLAVLFLNRACKFALSDLHPYPTGDGR